MKKFLIVAHIIGFLGFERNNMKLLQDMGYEVHCACNGQYSEQAKDRVRELQEAGLITHQIDFSRSPYDLPALRRAYHQLLQLMKVEQFDAVHCHTPVGGILARMAAHKVGIRPVLYTAHGFHFYKGCPLKNRLIYEAAERHFAKYTDALITINHEDYEAAQNMPVRGKVYQIPGVGLNLERFELKNFDRSGYRQTLGIAETDFMILSVGELNQNKNQMLVLKALSQMNNPNIHYCIAGTGPNAELYRNFVTEHHLEKQVHLLGFRSDIAELNHAADLFEFPSLREGLGMAALEALACGTPVCAVNNRGAREYVVDGETGFLHENTVEDCVRKLLMMMERDGDTREAMSEKCREMARKFSVECTQKVMTSVYQEILG